MNGPHPPTITIDLEDAEDAQWALTVIADWLTHTDPDTTADLNRYCTQTGRNANYLHQAIAAQDALLRRLIATHHHHGGAID